MEKQEEKQLPPAYTEQPLPSSNFTPAQTYQQYPGGPTQPPLYPPYIPQPPQPATTTGACVIINSSSLHHQPIPVGRDPTLVRCPSCQNDVLTTVQTTPSGRTHLFALGLCLIGYVQKYIYKNVTYFRAKPIFFMK